jgi:hypothetical protein
MIRGTSFLPAGQAELRVLPAIFGHRALFVGRVAGRGGLLDLRPEDVLILVVVNIVLQIDARQQLLGELGALIWWTLWAR